MPDKRHVLIQIVVTVLLLALGGLGLVMLTRSKPPLAKKKPRQVRPMVQVVKVDLAPRRVIIKGEGTVAPLRQSTLASQVQGRVVYLSPSLVDGGSFQKGQTLLRLERVDHELALALARSRVQEARTRLQTVREEAAAAREEWRRFQGKRGTPPPPLVIKKPQLDEARAKLQAAQAQMRQAELNLMRTEIKAPFQGRVIEKFVDLGHYLRAGERVATIFSTEAAEIPVYLDDRDLAWIRVPGFTGPGPGSPARVQAELAGRRRSWPGRVVRTQGRIDPRTRLVPVVVRVDDPYARRPPLAPGMFVEVEIEGRLLDRAALLPRAALRPGGVIWVVDREGRLHFRKVKVARTSGDQVLVREGLKQGELVVVSNLSAVSRGMAVRPVPLRRRPREAGS